MKNIEKTKGLIAGVAIGILIAGTSTFAATTGAGTIGSLFEEISSGVYKLIGTNIKTDSITADQLGINSVGAGELANNSVDTESIIDRTILGEDIAFNSISSNELGGNSVGNSELVDDITIDYARGLNNIYGDFGTIVQSTDEWLRINPSNSHSLGIYTNGLIRADGGLNIGNDEGFYRGAEDVIDTDDTFVVNNQLYVSTDPTGNDGVGNRNFNDGRYILKGGSGDDLEQNSVDSSEIEDGTLTYIDTNVDSIQRRIASSCPVGQSMRVINSDGTVVCEVDTDTNTWRGVVNNLSSYSSTTSLSANQGRILNNSKLGIGSKAADSNTLDGYDSSAFIRVGTSGDQLQDGTIDSSEIQDNTLTSNDLAANSVGNSELTDSPTFTRVYSQYFYYTSDKRLKKDIQAITSPIEKIKLLDGVKFTWRADGNKELGFIAQDVEKVIPELVNTDEEGMKSVKYGNITAILVEAVKEQSKTIEELKKEINLLKK